MRARLRLSSRIPEGIASEENAALGTDDIGPLEISNPELGNWTLKVYGYNVPNGRKVL